MRKLHPKKEFLRKYTEDIEDMYMSSNGKRTQGKNFSLKSLPRTGRRMALTASNVQLEEITTTTSTPLPKSYPNDRVYKDALNWHNLKEDQIVQNNEFDVTQITTNSFKLCIPYLPQLEITRLQETELAPDPVPSLQNNWASQNTVCQSRCPPPTDFIINQKCTVPGSTNARKDILKSNTKKKIVPPIRRYPIWIFIFSSNITKFSYLTINVYKQHI